MGSKDILDDVQERKEQRVIIHGGDKTQKKYPFHFRYQTPRGHIYEGEFTNNILTNDQKFQLQEIVSRLFGGAPFDSIDGLARYTATCFAHISISLDIEHRSEWAKDFGQLVDDDVILEIHKEVSSHEETFRGRRSDKKESEKKSEAGIA